MGRKKVIIGTVKPTQQCARCHSAGHGPAETSDFVTHAACKRTYCRQCFSAAYRHDRRCPYCNGDMSSMAMHMLVSKATPDGDQALDEKKKKNAVGGGVEEKFLPGFMAPFISSFMMISMWAIVYFHYANQ